MSVALLPLHLLAPLVEHARDVRVDKVFYLDRELLVDEGLKLLLLDGIMRIDGL